MVPVLGVQAKQAKLVFIVSSSSRRVNPNMLRVAGVRDGGGSGGEGRRKVFTGWNRKRFSRLQVLYRMQGEELLIQSHALRAGGSSGVFKQRR